MRRLVLFSVVILGLFTAASAQAAKTQGLAWAPGASFDYGTLDAADGGNAFQTFTLKNTGGRPTGALSISLTGSSAFTKTADTCTGTKLTAKRVCSVTVKYAPTANGSDSATLSASAPNTTGASDGLSGASAWQDGDLTTYDQSAWGDPSSVAATTLTADFGSVYASMLGVVEVGIPGTAGFSIQFSSSAAVTDYLPSVGTPGALSADLADPITSPSGNFGGATLGLQLNVDFADASDLSANSGLKFGDLTVCGLTSDTDLNGQTVRQVLATENTALGGGTTTNSIDDLGGIATNLNNSFSGGTVSTWAQDHLQPGSCP
jgi:hypothetical protein